MPTQAGGWEVWDGWLGGKTERKKAWRRRQRVWEPMAQRPGLSCANHTSKRSWETSVADKRCRTDSPQTFLFLCRMQLAGDGTDFSQWTHCLKSGQVLNKQRSPSELLLGCSLVLA